jgi:hypothetical protein
MYLFQDSNSAWDKQQTNTNFLSDNAEKGAYRSLRHEWKDNIKLDRKEAEYQDVKWIYLACEKDQ